MVDANFVATLAALRARYGEALASSGPAQARARNTLECQRTRWRKRNIADENIPAHVLLVESGHLPVRSAFSHLVDIGRLDELVAARVSETGIWYVQRIFIFTQKTDYQALTLADVSACAKSPGPKPCGPRGKMAFVSGLRAAIDRVVEYRSRRGEILTNPIPRPAGRRRAPKPEDFSALFTRDRDLMLAAWQALNLSRSTKRNWEKWYWVICRWLVEVDTQADPDAVARLERSGPCAMFLDLSRARRLCLYQAEPRGRGRRKSGAHDPRNSGSTIDAVLSVVRHMHLVGQGRRAKPSKADHFIDDIKRSFRRGERRRGPYTVGIDVRLRDVDPGLADGEVKMIRDSILEDFRRVRAKDPVPQCELGRLLREDLATELGLAVGPRNASMASFRADQIERRPDGTYWVRCLIKHPYLRENQPAVPEERVGDQTFSWWSIPGALMPKVITVLKHQGSDLKRWLESNGTDDEALVWVDVTEDETFGVVGRVAPLWFNGRNDYLRKGGIDALLNRIVQVRGGRKRGGGMVLRRTASRTIQKDVEKDPRLADELLHHNAAQNRRYAVEAISVIPIRYASYDIATNTVIAPTPPAAAVEPPVAPPKAARATGPRTKVVVPKFSMKGASNAGARRHRSTAA